MMRGSAWSQDSSVRSLPDITREELVELVRRISEIEGEEHEISFWVALLEANVPDPKVSELIYWPNHYFKDETVSVLTPEEVVDIALAYQVIALPPPVVEIARQ